MPSNIDYFFHVGWSFVLHLLRNICSSDNLFTGMLDFSLFSSLCVVAINPLADIQLTKGFFFMFSPKFYGLSLHLIIVSLATQRHLNFMQSQASILARFPVLLEGSLCLGLYLEVFIHISSNSSQDPGLTLTSFIQVDMIFVQVRGKDLTSFAFLTFQTNIQFSLHKLLRRLSFLQCMFSASDYITFLIALFISAKKKKQFQWHTPVILTHEKLQKIKSEASSCDVVRPCLKKKKMPRCLNLIQVLPVRIKLHGVFHLDHLG